MFDSITQEGKHLYLLSWDWNNSEHVYIHWYLSSIINKVTRGTPRSSNMSMEKPSFMDDLPIQPPDRGCPSSVRIRSSQLDHGCHGFSPCRHYPQQQHRQELESDETHPGVQFKHRLHGGSPGRNRGKWAKLFVTWIWIWICISNDTIDNMYSTYVYIYIYILCMYSYIEEIVIWIDIHTYM